MIKVICIIGESISEEFLKVINKLDKDDREIHIYENMSYIKDVPLKILKYIEELYEEDTIFWILIDSKELINLIYRIYNQIIDRFLLFAGENSIYHLESPYRELMKQDIMPEEDLKKQIEILEENITLEEKNVISNNENSHEKIQKYYFLKGKLYLFEPILSQKQKKIIFFIDEKKIKKFEDYCYWIFKGTWMQKQLFYVKKYAYIGLYENISDDIRKFLDQLTNKILGLGYFHKVFLIRMLSDLCDCLREEAGEFKLLIYSFLVLKFKMGCYTKDMVEQIQSEKFTIYNQIYLLGQLNRIGLTYPELKSVDSKILYRNILDRFREELKEYLIPIPQTKRSKDFILVITVQFLSENHAPTRTALERVYTLGKWMGKRVFLLNTRELATILGYLPLYDVYHRNIINDYDIKTKYYYKDYEFSFCQIPDEMPEFGRVEEILKFIRRIKPYMIMVIGNASIVGDICGDIVPTICIPVTFSTIPFKDNQYICIGRHLEDEERTNLKEAGYPVEHIIEGTFTFDLKRQQRKFTRKQLGLPEDKFLLIVIGIRLSTELNETFFHYLTQTFMFGAHLVFVGRLDNYDDWCEMYPNLKEHSSSLGMQEDVLAIVELCNLYINPYRIGGGFSLAECFSKGLPAVTINFGDVAAAAGSDFYVKNYEEMVLQIKRYIEDKQYYIEMSKKAKERVEQLTNSKAAMEEILEKAKKGSLFF